MSSLTSKRPFFPLLLVLLGLIAAASVTGKAFARPSDSPAQSQNQAPDLMTRTAFAHLQAVNGAPQNGGTVAAGTKFTLDLYVNTGGNQDVAAAQSYLSFDNSVLQVVSPSGTGCTPVQTVEPDLTTFEATLQNELCNGPNPCSLRGMSVPGGSIAFASGALVNCPQGCGGDFRVASITFCATNGGRATIHWQFSPPAPVTRDCEITVMSGDTAQDPGRYQDYVINVSGPTATPGAPTFTVVAQNVPTNTPVPSNGCNMNFNDVHDGDVFYDAIRTMYCRQVISGYNDATFRPYDYTMRAQIAKIVVLGFGFPTDTSNGPHFSDVPQSNQFYQYIETARNLGLVTGYNGNQFRPWEDVKRGQIAKIVVLAAAKKDPSGWALLNPSNPSFTDVPKSNVFYQPVETAKAHNLLAGCATNRFCVDDFAKRGQFCKIISGALPSN